MRSGQNALETRTSSVYLKLEKPYTNSTGWGATFAYTWTDSEQNSPIDGWPGARAGEAEGGSFDDEPPPHTDDDQIPF